MKIKPTPEPTKGKPIFYGEIENPKSFAFIIALSAITLGFCVGVLLKSVV
jgi:hypothetical protein